MALICRDPRRFGCSLALPLFLRAHPSSYPFVRLSPSLPRSCVGSLAFPIERIHFARFPFSRIDCACVQSRRATNRTTKGYRCTWNYDRSTRTFRFDGSASVYRLQLSAEIVPSVRSLHATFGPIRVTLCFLLSPYLVRCRLERVSLSAYAVRKKGV